METKKWLVFNFFMILRFHSSKIKSQQQYSANQVFDCNNRNQFLYTCNHQQAQHPPCQSFLMFKSKPPFDSVRAIAALMSSNPRELARINNVPETASFLPEKPVVVPVNCSCSGRYYRAITRFHITLEAYTYFVIANETFEGLSTCGSLKRSNPYSEFKLEYGYELKVLLRCACPTKDQISSGTKYLMTFPISFGDKVQDLAYRFHVTTESVLKANRFSESNPTLFPFTTLLIPLQAKPEPEPERESEPEPKPETSTKTSKAKKLIKLGIAAVCSFLVFTVVVAVVLWETIHRRRKDKAQENKEKAEVEMLPHDLLSKIASFERTVKVYSFREIQKATKNFDLEHRIKGSVFRGVFGNQIFAVKKMGIDVSNQVNMLSKINHINLIKLYGFSMNQDSLYLVFEHMTKGSLKDWLNGPRLEEARGLRVRVGIAVDVAYGLQYLHNFTKPGYIHKNINSSNILLDNNFRAKISNFGLARRTDDKNTTIVVGTRGYMAPEYVGNGSITSKVDVFSFGVVMLELITGKDAMVREGDREILLSTAMGRIMDREDAEMVVMTMIDLVDDAVGSVECAVQMMKLSLSCVKRDPDTRPSMDEVVASLVKIQVDLQSAVDRRYEVFSQPSSIDSIFSL